MSRPTLKAAIEWIALNDNPGEDTPGNPEAARNVASYMTTHLVADLFDVSDERVAARVMAYRRQEEVAARVLVQQEIFNKEKA